MNTEFLMESIKAGAMISIIGMGVVMFFLVLMMGVMNVTEKVMAKLAILFPEEVVETPAARPVTQSKNESELAIAIAATRKFLARGGN